MRGYAGDEGDGLVRGLGRGQRGDEGVVSVDHGTCDNERIV